MAVRRRLEVGLASLVELAELDRERASVEEERVWRRGARDVSLVDSLAMMAVMIMIMMATLCSAFGLQP